MTISDILNRPYSPIRIPTAFYFSRWYRYWMAWQEIRAIIRNLHQQDDLERLVKWAKRKRLKGPRTYYQRLLFDIQDRLLRQRVRFPHLMFWAKLLYNINLLISPAPQYHAKGSAAKYRLRS